MAKSDAQAAKDLKALLAVIRDLQKSRYWTQLPIPLRGRLDNALKEVKS